MPTRHRQNVRLPYWPMIADGDWDAHNSLLNYYLRRVPFLQARAQALLPNASTFPGMLWETETATVFGLFSEVDYVSNTQCGSPRPPNLPSWLQANPYVYLDPFGDGPTGELGLMILDRFLYDGNETALETRLPWLWGAIDYFAYRFPPSANGAITIHPTQALETLWCPWPISSAECVTNDMPTVAVVTRLLQRLLTEVPARLTPPSRAQRWGVLLAAMPPLPAAPSGALLPAAASSGKTHNSESAASYATHPARLFSVGRLLTGGVASLAPAIAAYRADPNAGGGEGNNGWHQGPMLAALLGLRNETGALFLGRVPAGPSLPGFRFPFFTAEDGMGDEAAAEVFSNLQGGVGLALVQPGEDAEGRVVVLPGWPCGWDVHFKLQAPRNTSVEVVWAGGKVRSLEVVPAERKGSVVIAPGC